MKSQRIQIVDLFCGCSGMGLGARRAGLDVALSVDVDPVLTSSHGINFPGERLELCDVAQLTGSDLRAKAQVVIDGIIGGPPCQGFSSIGRSDPDDPRRTLLKDFFRLVAECEPSFFVMENVKGLIAKKNIAELESALDLVREKYHIVGPLLLDAKDYGAATSRPRVFVFGFVEALHAKSFSSILLQKVTDPTTVRDAISDLLGAKSASQQCNTDFDLWQLSSEVNVSPYARRLRSSNNLTTGLTCVQHKDSIIRRFSAVAPGKIDKIGRHFRLSWSGQCPTLRAGTGPERGSYQSVRPLHPSLPRVINVREGARLQGFPDWFNFHRTSWHSFRMIGNSVSPIISEKIFEAIKESVATAFDQTSENDCKHFEPVVMGRQRMMEDQQEL